MDISIEEMLQAAYAEESSELIAALAQALSRLEQLDEPAWHETVLRMRRDVHTLKGSAGAVGLPDVANLCHEIEELLMDAAQPGSIAASTIDGLLAVLAALEDGAGKMSDAVTAALAATIAGASAPEPIDLAASAQPVAQPEASRRPKRRGHMATGPRILEPDELRGDQSLAAWAITTQPDLPARIEGAPSGEPDDAPSGDDDDDDAVDAGDANDVGAEPPTTRAEPPTERAPMDVAEATAQTTSKQTVRVDADRLETLRSDVADLTIESLRLQELGKTTRRLNAELGRLGKLSGHDLSPIAHALLKRIERDMFRLDVELRSRVQQGGLALEQVDEAIRDLSLQPLAPWLQTFAPAVRSAARSAHVEVRLELAIAAVEVGRAVLGRLREPMLHLLRNAVAHGIEGPAERTRVGKPRSGVIRCVGESDGERIRIEVTDDGRGIDRAALERQAQADGALQGRAGVSLLDLMSAVGVSTAGAAGELSGRGVGMGAARDAVTELGGTMDVTSTPGVGTTFVLQVPVRASRAKGIIVVAGGHTLAIPMLAAERVCRLDPAAVTSLAGTRCVGVNGALVPIFDLITLVAPEHAPSQQPTPATALVVLLRANGHRIAAIVDDVVSELQLVSKPLGAQFAAVPMYAGCAVSGDGAVLPVLDVSTLVNRAQTQRQATATRAAPKQSMRGRPVVLVVEDSMTMRTLERNLLVGAGYAVLTANDGLAGWELFNAHDDIDVVVSDVRMPRLDGFALCARIRASRRSDVPVILVTSLASDEDRTCGVAAGADGYVIKGDFEPQAFLSVVNRLSGLDTEA